MTSSKRRKRKTCPDARGPRTVAVRAEHVAAAAACAGRVAEAMRASGRSPVVWVAERTKSRAARRRAVLASSPGAVVRSLEQWIAAAERLRAEGGDACLGVRVLVLRGMLADADSRLRALLPPPPPPEPPGY